MARDLEKMAGILRGYLADGDRITGIRVLSSGWMPILLDILFRRAEKAL